MGNKINQCNLNQIQLLKLIIIMYLMHIKMHILYIEDIYKC